MLLDFFIASAFVNALSFVVIGLFVFFIGYKNRSNQLYALFSAAVALWSVSYVIWLKAGDEVSGLFWAKMLNFWAIFIPIFFCHWLFVLLGIEKQKAQKLFLIFAYGATALFAIFGFHPYYVDHVEQKLFFPYYPMPGMLHPFYLLISWGFILAYSYIQLFKAWKTSLGYKKTQLKYLLIAMPIGFGGGFTNYFFWYGLLIPPWANILVSVWGLSFIYIVFRYRFMDIRWILGRTGIYLLSFTPVAFWAYLFSRFAVIPQDSLYALLSYALFSLVAISIYGKSFNFFERIAGKYLYYSLFNLREKISALSEKMNQMIDLDELSNFMINSLTDALKVEKAALVLKNLEKLNFYVQKTAVFPQTGVESILAAQLPFLLFLFGQDRKILARDNMPFIKDRFKDDQDRAGIETKLALLEKDLAAEGISVVVPFFVKDSLIGMIILGEKATGKPYTAQELDLLKSLISQASVAFNNSLSYDEIQQKRVELEKFYKLTIGRELRMAELKEQIKKMETKDIDKNNLQK